MALNRDLGFGQTGWSGAIDLKAIFFDVLQPVKTGWKAVWTFNTDRQTGATNKNRKLEGFKAET